MKRRNLVCGAALFLLIVGFAVAQDVLAPKAAPLAVILPPTPVYSNCGVGCTAWGSQAYYINGNSAPIAPGQTLAVQFRWKGTARFKNVYEANDVFANGPTIGARILNNTAGGLPGGLVRNLAVTNPNCPGGVPQACVYRLLGPPLFPAPGTKLWLCQYALNPTEEGGWFSSLSNNSTATNFAFNANGACVGVGVGWTQVGAGFLRPAFEVNGP